MMIINCRKVPLAAIVVVVLVNVLPVTVGISIPFFGSFSGSNRQQTPSPLFYNEHNEARIINSHHGGNNNDGTLSPSSSGASLAGGSYHSPWISGTRDQFIRDQLVVLHPDSPHNREAWKESGYLNMESDTLKNYNNEGMYPKARTPPARKPTRKSKQQAVPTKTESAEKEESDPSKYNPTIISTLEPASNGGVYELLPIPLPYTTMFRDLNQNHNADLGPAGEEHSTLHHEPMLLSPNNFLLPFSHFFPYSPRAISSHSTLPPEAMIQLLKSPEQQITGPLTRPQVKLPFPLSHDCSANNGGGSKPLQFVVLPIVEPVAPLKPIFPKPSFLSSQYGQFPYIPPFNLFNKKPSVYPTSNLDGSTGTSQGGSSGQFVPILNRPAPPLPFVFVQSLPLELIGQNVELDILNSSPSQTSESKINEQSPVAPPQFSSGLQQPTSVPQIENNPEASQSLPLIVIEKKKTPGQLPSSQIAPAAAVVEISKQSIPKSGTGNGSLPLSTISVVKPITAPGREPQTAQQQQEIHKAIEKLVPVAAAVLENVEKQQKLQKDELTTSTVALTTDSNGADSSSSTTESAQVLKPNEKQKTSLRPPLRPDLSTEGDGSQKAPLVLQNNVEPTRSVSEEIGLNPTSMMSEVEITEA